MSASAQSRLLRLRYDGICSVCAAELERRTEAWWLREEKQIICTTCRPKDADPDSPATPPTLPVPSPTGQDPTPDTPGAAPLPPDEPLVVPPLTTDGEAGASARREGERRRSKREREALERHLRLGKLILAVSDEPRSVRSWGKGAVGEEALGAKLNSFANERVVILHDRRVPGSRANIDHIAVSPGGVFVIDAKHYSGQGWTGRSGRLSYPR